MKVITADNMRLLESKANENGLSYETMMINAGENAGKVIEKYINTNETITVLCGKGKNALRIISAGFVVSAVSVT